MKKQLMNALLARYKSYKQKNNNGSLQHCFYVAKQMLKRSKYCFLVTHGEGDWCSARLVEPIIETGEDGKLTLWIGTRKDLRKTDEIWSNPKVTLTFENTREDANLVIYGNAFIETDPEIKKKHWKTTWQLFFPSGPKSDEYVVIRIEPSRMEIVNFSKNITPEPFGLKSAVLLNHQGQWQIG